MPTPEQWRLLDARMSQLKIEPSDLLEKFILGSGSGGQKINKTSSCVYLKHLPSGTEVKCQSERSRELNRFIARTELCQKLESAELTRRLARKQADEKNRRKNRKPSLRSHQRRLDNKIKQGQKKSLRKPPKADS